MKKEYIIQPDHKLTFEKVFEIHKSNYKLRLSPESENKINHCRTYLDKKTKGQKDPVYGVNTGFGSLCDVKISDEDLGRLQENLVKSHACGVGDEVPKEVVKLMLFLKVQSLAYGHSGVQLETVNRLLDMYNYDVLPVVYQQGSLGASGDLAPLAHLALPLLSKGEVYYQGKRRKAGELNHELGWNPIALQSKEGLALLNGTQFMGAYGVYSLIKLFRLSQLADICGAISLEGFDGRKEPFNDLVHQVRRQSGQIKTAEIIRELLDGSELIDRDKAHVQDPYSFRCIPQ
ncbi:MAG TPA: aromatic amino acid ammonia-lyase, partial [Bacteroidales bacterium]|nr:aromatic amino acid ammonia-lyase [Bacteroidales bacterium]